MDGVVPLSAIHRPLIESASMTKHSLVALSALFLSSAAFAGNTPTPVTPGYQVCSNASGATTCGFIPVDTSHPLPVTTTSSSPGVIPVAGTFSNADTTTATATLAGAAGKTTSICSFSVSGLGATAATPVTVTVGTLTGGGTLSYSYLFQTGATAVNTPLTVNYSPCIAANASNTAITITVPGAAGNTSTQINANGFQQ